MNGDHTTQLNLWIARLGRGDDSALDEILVFFEERLVRLVRRMLRSYPDVRRMEETGDVLQNATLRLNRALRARAMGGDRGALHTRDFLGLAALQIRRELIDLAKHYRSGAVLAPPVGEGRGGGEDSDRVHEKIDCSTWDPDRLSEWTEFHQQVAILPDRPREIFDLLWYQGMSQAEAAKLLGVDVRTVKSRWQDARLRLNAAMRGRRPGD